MTALPSLPGCGAPVQYRLEMFTGTGQVLAPVEATIAACSQHIEPFTVALTAAGGRVFRVQTPPGARCGNGFDFTTMTPIYGPKAVAEPATDHPAWCHRPACTASATSGDHVSELRQVVPEPADSTVWHATLVQPVDPEPITYLEVSVLDEGEMRTWALPLRQAANLARTIRHLVDDARRSW